MTAVQQTSEEWLGRVTFSKQCRKVIRNKALWIRWTPWVITHLGHITLASSKIASHVTVWPFVKIDDKTLSHKTLFCIYKTFNKSQIFSAWVKRDVLNLRGAQRASQASLQFGSHFTCVGQGMYTEGNYNAYNAVFVHKIPSRTFNRFVLGLLKVNFTCFLVLARMEVSILRVWLYFWFLSDQDLDTSELFFVTPFLLGLWYQQLFFVFVFVFVFYHFYSCFGFIREDERIGNIKCEVEIIQINITECLSYDRH